MKHGHKEKGNKAKAKPSGKKSSPPASKSSPSVQAKQSGEASPSYPDKVAALLFALLPNSPLRGGNRRVALAPLFAFCELKNKPIDGRVFDEKTAETLFKRAAGYRELGIAPENVFREIREI